MRIRFKPWARPELEASKFYIDNPEEYKGKWKETFKSVTLTGDWIEDTIAIAKTQLGYTESEKNYQVMENGDVKGYTRYGEWYRDKYNEYCNAHPCAVPNGTMKNYRSQWKKANDLFYEAYYEIRRLRKTLHPRTIFTNIFI